MPQGKAMPASEASPRALAVLNMMFIVYLLNKFFQNDIFGYKIKKSIILKTQFQCGDAMYARNFQSHRLALDFGFTRARHLGGVYSGVWRKAVHLAGLSDHRASGLDMLRLMGRQARAWLSRVRHRLPASFLSDTATQLPLTQPVQLLDQKSAQRVTALHSGALAAEGAWLFRSPLWWGVALLLLSLQWPQLMARNDDVTVVWTPPVEPPGTVIVTANNTEPRSAQTAGAQVSAARVAVAPSLTVPDRAVPSAAATAMATTAQPQPVMTGNHASPSRPDLAAPTGAAGAALQSALDQWSRAWGQQNLPVYLAMYADNFTTPQGMSRSAWEKMRRQRIMGKQKISHEIRDVAIQFEASKAVVTFTQIYEDERIKATDRKTLHWVQRDGRWLITRETTG